MAVLTKCNGPSAKSTLKPFGFHLHVDLSSFCSLTFVIFLQCMSTECMYRSRYWYLPPVAANWIKITNQIEQWIIIIMRGRRCNHDHSLSHNATTTHSSSISRPGPSLAFVSKRRRLPENRLRRFGGESCEHHVRVSWRWVVFMQSIQQPTATVQSQLVLSVCSLCALTKWFVWNNEWMLVERACTRTLAAQRATSIQWNQKLKAINEMITQTEAEQVWLRTIGATWRLWLSFPIQRIGREGERGGLETDSICVHGAAPFLLNHWETKIDNFERVKRSHHSGDDYGYGSGGGIESRKKRKFYWTDFGLKGLLKFI